MDEHDDGPGARAMTLRLDEDLYEQLRMVAGIDDRSLSATIREAIAGHVERRRADPAFQAALERTLQRHRQLFDVLLDQGDG